jgi:hypothetical protein
VRFRKVRNLPGREPRFWLQHWDENAGWLKGAGGADTSILYRIDEIADAIEQGRVIAVVEGEKDADNLRKLDIPATCNAHGASEPGKKPKWTSEHSAQLGGADIIVFNDNDPMTTARRGGRSNTPSRSHGASRSTALRYSMKRSPPLSAS